MGSHSKNILSLREREGEREGTLPNAPIFLKFVVLAPLTATELQIKLKASFELLAFLFNLACNQNSSKVMLRALASPLIS